MKIEKIINTIQTEELEITGATLLSIEEVGMLPKELREYKDWWWLRSPGSTQDCAAYVYPDGSVDFDGNYVDCDRGCVRPALKIANLESSNLKIGDCFLFGEKEFKIVSETLAFCKSDIGTHCFHGNWRSDDANVYEKSDIKKFVGEWFERNNKFLPKVDWTRAWTVEEILAECGCTEEEIQAVMEDLKNYKGVGLI